MLCYLFAALIGYFCGSVPAGAIIARLFRLGDLRQIGSGNIGATNVLRTGNKKAALFTLLFDGFKGFVAVAAALLFLKGGGEIALIAGLFALLGHIFPIWLKFRGGKGVATFLGAQFGFSLTGGLIACALWLCGGKVSKISSVGAITAALFTAPAQYFLLRDEGAALFSLVAGAVLLLTHRANIRRLCAGEEGKIKF